MKRLAPAALLLLVVGCYIAVHDDDDDERRDDDRWTQQATMRTNERALFDGGQLEITLQEASPGRAVLLVEDDRGQSTVELRGTGPGAGIHWPPYHVWLASAGSGTATITVSKTS